LSAGAGAGPPSGSIDAATPGRAVALAIKEDPYSSNYWRLAAIACAIATGQEIDDVEEIPELIERLSGEAAEGGTLAAVAPCIVTAPEPVVRCACVRSDAYDCAAVRYNDQRPREEGRPPPRRSRPRLQEPCECPCHDRGLLPGEDEW
jgi:hypothetical protein